MTQTANRKCGFIALLGAPNAGKSTLLNKIVGEKVAIVTPKVQTTRTRLLAVTNKGDSQLVFIDTPGIFVPKKRLERAMVSAAWTGASEADEIVLLIDASRRKIDEGSRLIIDRLKEEGRQVILALNKIDQMKKEDLLSRIKTLSDEGVFKEIFLVSALSGDGVDKLVDHLASSMPQGPFHYPEDQLSDMPIKLMAAELTREQLFLNLYQELPYSLTVETESWKEQPDGSIKISQIIFVEREGHRAIILGKGGAQIKKIGIAARQEIEKLTEMRVHLNLFVKIRPAWQDDPSHYKVWGLDHNA